MLTSTRRKTAIGGDPPATHAQPPPRNPFFSSLLAEALRNTVQQIRQAGPHVVLMGITPRFPEPVPECLAAADGNAEDCQVALTEAIPQNHWPSVVQGVSGAHILDLTDTMCPEGMCLTDADGILRWMDTIHMTATFARTLGPELRTDLANLLNEV